MGADPVTRSTSVCASAFPPPSGLYLDQITGPPVAFLDLKAIVRKKVTHWDDGMKNRSLGP